MNLWVAIVSPEFILYKSDGSGVVFKNFKNAIRELFFSDHYSSFETLKAQHEQNPNTKVYNLSEAVYNSLLTDLTIDQYTNIPKWQINPIELEEIGSYEDPEDTGSTWQQGVPISDYRYRVILRHNASFSNGENVKPTISDSAPDKIILQQYDKTTGEPNNRVVVGLELFNKNGVKMSGFTQNDLVFYNGATPTVVDFVDGFAEVYIRTDEPRAKDSFRSNHEYRVDKDNRRIDIVVMSRTLND